MSKKIKATTNILMYALIGLIAYFMANFVIVSKVPVEHFDCFQYWIAFILIVLLAIPYFYFDWKYNNYRPNRLLLLVSIVLFVSGLIVVLKVPDSRVYSAVDANGDLIKNVIYFTPEERVVDILSLAVTLFTAYFLFVSLPKHFRFKRHSYLILFAVLLIVSSMIIYTYIFEWHKYIDFFKILANGKRQDDYKVVASYFYNKNSYALVLFIAVYVLLVMHQNNHKWFYLVLSFITYLHIIFTFCKAAIIAGFILFFGYLLIHFILSYKKHKKRNMIVLSIVLLCFVGLTIFLFSHLKLEREFISNFYTQSERTVNSRGKIWKYAVSILNQTSWFFGAGYVYYNDVLLGFCGDSARFDPIPKSHNTFLAFMGQGGILMLVGYALYLTYFVYALVKIFKKEKYLALGSLIGFLSVSLYGLVESLTPIFDDGIDHMLLTIVLFAPVLSRYYRYKCPLEDVKIIKSADEYKQKKVVFEYSPFNFSRIFYFIITPIISIYTGFLASVFIPKSWNSGYHYRMSVVVPYLVVGIILIVFFIIAPYLFQLLYNKKKNIEKSANRFGLYILNEALFYYLTGFILTLIVFLFVIASNKFAPNEYLARIETAGEYFGEVMPDIILISVMATILYLTVFMMSKTFRLKSGCLDKIDHALNKFLIRCYAKFITKERHTFDGVIRLNESDYAKTKILLIAPEEFYYGDKLLNFDLKNCFLNRYSNKYSKKKIFKLFAKFGRFTYEDFSWKYLSKILYQNLLISYDYVIIADNQILTRKMIQEIKDFEKEAQIIYYDEKLDNKYNKNHKTLDLFDEVYTLNQSIHVANATYLNSVNAS